MSLFHYTISRLRTPTEPLNLAVLSAYLPLLPILPRRFFGAGRLSTGYYYLGTLVIPEFVRHLRRESSGAKSGAPILSEPSTDCCSF